MDIFEIVSHIEQSGYCVVESVIPVNEVDAFVRKLLRSNKLIINKQKLN